MSTLPSVSGGIRGIHELPRNEGAGDGFREFFGLGNGALHTLGTFCENDFSTVGREQLAAFHAHRFGHREDRAIAAARSDARQPDPRVAARGFNDDGAGFQKTAFFGVFHHRKRNTVFHTARRIEVLKLHENLGFEIPLFFIAVNFNERRAADEFGNRVVDTHGENLPGSRKERFELW